MHLKCRIAAPVLIVAVGLAGCGCAASPSTRDGAATSESALRGGGAETASTNPLLDAGENIERLSAAERPSGGEPRHEPLRQTALPPGVDPTAVQARPEDDPRAWLGLDAALREVAGRSGAFTPPPPAPDLPAEQAELALRHYARGRDLVLSDRLADAITEFVRALQIDPGNPRILRELARAYLATGNETRAVALYEQMLRSEPDDELALFIVGVAATERRNYELAVAALGRPALGDGAFRHDLSAPIIAAFELAVALDGLGYDRAFIEVGSAVLNELPRAPMGAAYQRQHGAIYRRRAMLAQALGDALFRLGRAGEALSTYEQASQINGADVSALLPRIIYANLVVGQEFSAQRALLDEMRGRLGDRRAVDDRESYLRALADDPADSISVGDREILLCTYLRGQIADISLLVEAVNNLYLRRPDNSGLARAAAALQPDKGGLEVLEDFIARRPRDLNVIRQQFAWLARRDEAAAVRLAVRLADMHPDLASEYARRLVHSLPRPGEAAAIARQLPDTPGRGLLVIGLFEHQGALGRAWAECEAALQRWPDHQRLLMERVRLAAELDEPALVERAIVQARRPADVDVLIVTSRALTSMDEHRRAIEAANEAVRLEPENVRTIAAYAMAMAQYAATLTTPEDRAMWIEDAAEAAEEALRLDPSHDEAYSVLMALHGPSGLAPDPRAYNALLRRLATERPESRLALLLQAQDELVQRRFESALEKVLDLYQGDPSDSNCLAISMAAWIGLDRLADAERWFVTQLEQRPGDPGLLGYWKEVQLRRGQADVAVAYFQREVEASDVNFAARRLLEESYREVSDFAAMAALREPRLLSRPQGTRRETDLAAMYAESGAAEKAYERLVWVGKHVADARREHLLRAIDTAGRLQIEPAQRDALLSQLASDTLDRFPASPLELYRVALSAQARQGQTGESFEALARRAVTLAPGALDSTAEAVAQWTGIAQDLVNQGQAAAAGRVLRARLEADPQYESQSTLVLAVRTLAVDAATEGGATRTIALIEDLDRRRATSRLFSVQGGLPEIYYVVSNFYSIVDNQAGSNALLRKSLDVDPAFSMAMNNLGYTLVVAGNDDPETIKLLEDAYLLQPDNANILDSLGWLRYRQGRFSDGDGGEPGAMTLIRKAVAANRDVNPEVNEHLGDALWRMGETERAVATWRKTLAVIEAPNRRAQMIENYRDRQMDWGLLVKDPEALYENDEGALLKRLKAKIAAAEAGETPAVAPTFEELGRQRTEGDH